MPDIVMLCALSDYFQVTTDELLDRCHMEKCVICDDSAFVHGALYDILKKEGIQNITLAETGEQLLETFAKEKALQLGADKYITKPFLPEQIITALEAVK